MYNVHAPILSVPVVAVSNCVCVGDTKKRYIVTNVHQSLCELTSPVEIQA